MAASTSLQATWKGHVSTTRGALVLFEGCLNGTLSHVPRRPHDRERSLLIRSGSVFIYEENASGIKRWTDGVPWSPSRILGNFLVYRELTKPFPPGEKKRATKRNKRPTRPGEPYPRSSADTPASPTTPGARSENGGEVRDGERALIGSLVDSYGFKEGGLVKKTMSVQVLGVHHHLVSYYSLEDVLSGHLQTVTQDMNFKGMDPRVELLTRQNFRSPLDGEDDHSQDGMDHSQQNLYAGGYDPTYDRSRHYASSGPHGHQPGALDMHLYGHGPPQYASSAQMQSGVHGFAPGSHGASNFYSANHSMGFQPTQSYSQAPNYGTNYASHGLPLMTAPDRSTSQAQQAQSGDYGYARHHTMPGIQPRPNPMVDPNSMHDQGARDSSWGRGGSGGVYGPTASTGVGNPSHNYSYPNGSQMNMAPSVQSIPRNPDLPLSGFSESWPMHQPVSSRQQTYASQHN